MGVESGHKLRYVRNFSKLSATIANFRPSSTRLSSDRAYDAAPAKIDDILKNGEYQQGPEVTDGVEPQALPETEYQFTGAPRVYIDFEEPMRLLKANLDLCQDIVLLKVLQDFHCADLHTLKSVDVNEASGNLKMRAPVEAPTRQQGCDWSFQQTIPAGAGASLASNYGNGNIAQLQPPLLQPEARKASADAGMFSVVDFQMQMQQMPIQRSVYQRPSQTAQKAFVQNPVPVLREVWSQRKLSPRDQTIYQQHREWELMMARHTRNGMRRQDGRRRSVLDEGRDG